MSGDGVFVRGVAPGVVKRPRAKSEEVLRRSEYVKVRGGFASTVRIVQEVDGLLESASARNQTMCNVSIAYKGRKKRLGVYHHSPSCALDYLCR